MKKVFKQCYVYKLIQGKSLLPPKTSSLPSFQVNSCYPFETTGPDYPGPLYVNVGNDDELRKC